MKHIIKNLQDLRESTTGLGCTFWACEGYKSGRIKSMITCSHCQIIIILDRQIKKLKSLNQ